MKFLCVVCDVPMKLEEAKPPEDGSITAIFECPECFHQIAMLTNPMETQAVTSLGISIAPGAGERAAAGGCPFSSMVQDMEAEADGALPWTTEALTRLETIPEFVRPMARQGIEQFARDRGSKKVDESVMDAARDRFTG